MARGPSCTGLWIRLPSPAMADHRPPPHYWQPTPKRGVRNSTIIVIVGTLGALVMAAIGAASADENGVSETAGALSGLIGLAVVGGAVVLAVYVAGRIRGR